MSTLALTDLFIVQRPAGGDKGTYKIEWESVLDNIAASPAVQFKGTANFTDSGDDPSGSGRDNGDLWVNTTDGTFAWANPETASKAVVEGDYCIWDADDGVWRFIGAVGGGTGGVTSVDATAPVLMSGDDTTGDVVVELDLATKADVDNATANKVVTADVLNSALGDLPSGGLTSVIGVNPESGDIPGNWDNGDADWNTDLADKYATPAVKVYDNREISVHFATKDQVGVNYLAPADTGAVMDFNGAERDADGMGHGVDNLGAMTARRTYNNFVPRNFELLTELPS